MPTYDTLTVATEDGIATLVFNRPKSLNAFDPTLVTETQAALAAHLGGPVIAVALGLGTSRLAQSCHGTAEEIEVPGVPRQGKVH